jgi:hypothetical protein
MGNGITGLPQCWFENLWKSDPDALKNLLAQSISQLKS